VQFSLVHPKVVQIIIIVYILEMKPFKQKFEHKIAKTKQIVSENI